MSDEAVMFVIVGNKNFEVFIDGRNVRLKPTRKRLVIPETMRDSK
jgi:hypothetical protein